MPSWYLKWSKNITLKSFECTFASVTFDFVWNRVKLEQRGSRGPLDIMKTVLLTLQGLRTICMTKDKPFLVQKTKQAHFYSVCWFRKSKQKTMMEQDYYWFYKQSKNIIFFIQSYFRKLCIRPLYPCGVYLAYFY